MLNFSSLVTQTSLIIHFEYFIFENLAQAAIKVQNVNNLNWTCLSLIEMLLIEMLLIEMLFTEIFWIEMSLMEFHK